MGKGVVKRMVSVLMGAVFAVLLSNAGVLAQHRTGLMIGQAQPLAMMALVATERSQPDPAQPSFENGCQAHSTCTTFSMVMPANAVVIVPGPNGMVLIAPNAHFATSALEILLPPPLLLLA